MGELTSLWSEAKITMQGEKQTNSELSRMRTTRNSLCETATEGPFRSGLVVLLSLANPREKFWGTILDLSPAGIAIRGIDLSSFDDTVRMLRHEEPIDPSDVFFPMHRVERMELDTPCGSIPSLSQRFETGTGRELRTFLRL